jgi:peptide/nickel transport system ATP-binding protein
MHFPVRRGFLQRVVGHVKAVDGVSFTIYEGETLGLVGESGSGKTTTGHCIVRIHAPTGGTIHYHRANGTTVDLAALDEKALRPYRREIRMVFQDPQSSLNPRLPVRDIIGEPLRVHGVRSGDALTDRVAELLEQVGLPSQYMERYPHAFSGGERQRIGIARALALEPRLVIADEPVSALDVSVQARTLNLMNDLQERFGLTYLFIAHDLSVVRHISDRVAVMYAGRIVELAPTRALFTRPAMPYTEALLSAIPQPRPSYADQDRVRLKGEVPDPANLPSGCVFHPRCPYAEPRCQRDRPRLRKLDDGHWVACHFAEDLDLAGVKTGAPPTPPPESTLSSLDSSSGHSSSSS